LLLLIHLLQDHSTAAGVNTAVQQHVAQARCAGRLCGASWQLPVLHRNPA
jgi:hypothetical protein